MYWSVIDGYGLYELHVYMHVKTVTGGEGEGESTCLTLTETSHAWRTCWTGSEYLVGHAVDGQLLERSWYGSELESYHHTTWTVELVNPYFLPRTLWSSFSTSLHVPYINLSCVPCLFHIAAPAIWNHFLHLLIPNPLFILQVAQNPFVSICF